MLNENIKARRKSKGLSQQELAVRPKVVRQTASKWEQGLSAPASVRLSRVWLIPKEAEKPADRRIRIK